ncbi:MAG: PilZ domain-containing protein [Gammaproteobacteria bacterium]|nr:PilZ domain-containing protein [Gammaproteobacteria bacterium]
MSILRYMSRENYKNSSQERRRFTRVPFIAEIVMQCGDEEWTCNLLDISLNGMLVEPPTNIKVNPSNPCAVALFLANDVVINARARIKHTDTDHWGLQYLSIDIESLKQLRRLLEMNFHDHDLIDRELSQLSSDIIVR